MRQLAAVLFQVAQLQSSPANASGRLGLCAPCLVARVTRPVEEVASVYQATDKTALTGPT